MKLLCSLFALAVLMVVSTAYEAAGKGPLRIHSKNPRYFADGQGNAVFLTGSHTWATFQERGVEGQTPDFDYEEYLDFMERNGHNFLRMWRWEHSQWMQFVPRNTLIRYEPMAYMRTGPGKAIDGKLRFDLDKFNQAYFDRLRERVVQAGGRGIYVSVMLFQGFSVEQKGTKGVEPDKGNAWDGHPYNKSNNINSIDGDLNGDGEGIETHTLRNEKVLQLQEAYVRKVVDTLNELDNVLWEISNESHPDSIPWQYHLIEIIKEYEATKPIQHPVGMTSSPISNPPLFAGPADWISPNTNKYLEDPPASTGTKVIIVDNDHIMPWKSNPDWVWKNLLRGNHFILMDHYRDFRMGCPARPEPKHDPARRAMGYARKVAERVDLASMVPAHDLCSTGYCLANVGTEYLVYKPDGTDKQLVVDLKAGTYSVEWINCQDGEVQRVGNVEVKGRSVFASPFAGPAVCHLAFKE